MNDILSALSEKHRLDGNERDELAAYTANRYAGAVYRGCGGSEHLRGWDSVIRLAEEYGAADIINRKLCPNRPVSFASPAKVSICIFDSFAGRIPVIFAGDPQDFEQLVTNIVHKGIRPADIGKTGASFVSVKTLRFIILSSKPYSNVTAPELGLGEEEWAEKSMIIRRSHECTHFFTKQGFGIAANNLHDELMADFIGLYDAFGFYRAEWFLRFMGIVEGSGGRLAVYTKDLSAKAGAALTELVSAAARELESWQHTAAFKTLSDAERILLMCEAGIEGMAQGKLYSSEERI